MPTSRSAILAALAVGLLFVLPDSVTSRASAQSSDSEASAPALEETRRERLAAEEEEVRGGLGAEEEYRNALAFGFIYTLSVLKPEEREATENLFGFDLVYERVLIPNHLAISIAKPFLFNRERYDSPLEILVKALIRRGSWEPFFGLGLHNNLRVFPGEREEQEGKRVEYAVGLLTAAGFTFLFTPHWGLALELAYVYIFNEKSVSQHEVSPSLNAVYFFERGQRRRD